MTTTLPFDSADAIKDAAAFLAELVRQGLTFTSQATGGSITVTFTGGF